MTGINILVPKGFGRVDGQQALDEILGDRPAEPARSNANPVPTPAPNPVIPPNMPAKLNPADFVQIPGYDVMISKDMVTKEKEWKQTHFYLAEKGLFMPRLDHMTTYLTNVLNASEGKTTLYDGAGRALQSTEANLLLNNLLFCKNDYDDLWLDGLLSLERKGFFGVKPVMYTDHRVVSLGKDKILSNRVVNIENRFHSGKEGMGSFLAGTASHKYVVFDFDSNGFPTTSSSNQEYIPKVNLSYRIPKNASGALALRCNGKLTCFAPDLPSHSLGCVQVVKP